MLGSIYITDTYKELSNLPEVTQLGLVVPGLEHKSFEFKAKICSGIMPIHLVQKLCGKNNYLKKAGLLKVETKPSEDKAHRAVNLHAFSPPRCVKHLNWSYARSVNIYGFFMLTIEISIHEGNGDNMKTIS